MTGITIRSLQRVWQANQDDAIPSRLATILGISAAEARTLLEQ